MYPNDQLVPDSFIGVFNLMSVDGIKENSKTMMHTILTKKIKKKSRMYVHNMTRSVRIMILDEALRKKNIYVCIRI